MSIYLPCPHCSKLYEIVQLNCRIFRCGVYKHNLNQIEPHMCKEKCDHLANTGAIYGCGKPFMVVPVLDASGSFKTIVCEYI